MGLLLLVPFATARAQAPALSPIVDITVNAGTSTTVNVIAVDASGRQITLTSSLPSFATLNSPAIGLGEVVTTLTLTPAAIHVGDYTAAVTATAGGTSDLEIFRITVNAEGSPRAPLVSAPALQPGTTGSTVGFVVNVNDVDGGGIASLTASPLPTGAMFTPDASNSSATFSWTPGPSDVGEYDVRFDATSVNGLAGGTVTHLRIASAPGLVIDPIDDVTVAGGSSISVPVSASGPTGALITLTASLPAFATLNPPGSGTDVVNTTITVTPPQGSAGTYHAAVTATSEDVSVTEAFDIIVTGSGGGENRAPVLSAPASRTVAVGSSLSFDVTASDPDGDHVDLLGSALPPGSTFLDHGNDTGTFTWSPTDGQAGVYTASFSGLDNRGGSGAASTEITVTGGTVENRNPTLSAPPMVQVDEGEPLSFSVTANDPDGDHVTLTVTSLPSGATFSDQGDNTALVSWTPDSTQSGVYDVSFNGSDGRGGSGSAITTIMVQDVDAGGGNEVPGAACLIGRIESQRETTCFRVKPVDGSFDPRDVVLASLTLQFQGASIAALGDGTGLDIACHDRDKAAGDLADGGAPAVSGDDDDDRDRDRDRRDGDRDDRGGDRDDDHDDDHDGNRGDPCGVSCPDSDDHEGDDDHPGHGHDCADHRGNGHDCDREHQGNGHNCDGDGDDDGDSDHANCDVLGIHVCFSTAALIELFAGAELPCDLLQAEVRAALTNGATLVATFQHHDDGDDNDDDGHHDDGVGNDDPDDDHAGDDYADGDDHDRGDADDDAPGHPGDPDGAHIPSDGLTAKIGPNPFNPSTELTFAMPREGRVRVTIYDLQGRVVKTLLNETRASGEQKVRWDGSNSRNQAVPSGLYIFRIETPAGQVIRKAAMVK